MEFVCFYSDPAKKKHTSGQQMVTYLARPRGKLTCLGLHSQILTYCYRYEC